MKAHLVVQLAPGVVPPDVPHWTERLRGPSGGDDRLHPSIDRVVHERSGPVLVTKEYQRAGPTWSADEIAAGLDRVYRLVLLTKQRVPPGLVDSVRLLPVVERVEPGRVAIVPLPDRLATPLSKTSDWAREAIGLPAAHAVTTGNRDVTVAVLDTGVEVDHPELRHAIVGGADFVDIIDDVTGFIGDIAEADADPEDEVGHGTHVAGVVAGAGRGMPPGVAPGVGVLAVRVLAAMRRGDDVRGAGLVDNINVGVKHAVDEGVDVINMSLGVRHTGGGLPHREVMEYAARRGVTVVAASGNDGTDMLYFPGVYPSVVTVGAVGRDDLVTPFSTYGPQVDLVAPGTEIRSAGLDGSYTYASGTSHAAPFVAGTVALMKSLAASKGRRYSDRHCQRALRATADRPGRKVRDLHHGFGRLNTADAIRYVNHDLDNAGS